MQSVGQNHAGGFFPLGYNVTASFYPSECTEADVGASELPSQRTNHTGIYAQTLPCSSYTTTFS